MKHDYKAALEWFLKDMGCDCEDCINAHAHKKAILHALRFAEKMMQEPSDKMLSSAVDAISVRRAFYLMRDAALKELGE